jgi:hypothetical protein
MIISFLLKSHNALITGVPKPSSLRNSYTGSYPTVAKLVSNIWAEIAKLKENMTETSLVLQL